MRRKWKIKTLKVKRLKVSKGIKQNLIRKNKRRNLFFKKKQKL